MSSHTHSLLKVLGVTFGLAVTIGNVIGAGILRTPGTVAAELPTVGMFLLVWVIGGLYALLGANALAELGTLVPRSGGQYVFVRHALGDYAGFVVGWSDWISTCGTTAFVAIVIGEMTVALFPDLRAVEVVALVAVGALTLVQWFGVRWGEWAQNITSVLKTAALLLLVAACFYLGGRNPSSMAFEPEVEGSLLLAFIVALQAVIYTYDGWTSVIYFSEEVKEPSKNIPRAMLGGVLLVIVIYLLINVAFLRVVPLPTIANQDFAAGVVAQHLFGPQGDTFLRALMLISLLSALNSNILMAPRVIYAMTVDRLFWRAAGLVNAGGTPDVALLISSVIAVLFVMSGKVSIVLAVLAFFFVANYTLSFISVFVLRIRQAETPRPYRAWGHPVTTGIALLASVGFLVGAIASDTRNSLFALAILFLSLPVFFVIRRFRHELPIRSAP